MMDFLCKIPKIVILANFSVKMRNTYVTMTILSKNIWFYRGMIYLIFFKKKNYCVPPITILGHCGAGLFPQLVFE